MHVMRFLGSLTLAVLTHVFLGWSWSISGGILYGYLLKQRPGFSGLLKNGLLGAVCVGLAWGGLVAYNFFLAPSTTWFMAEVMGGILGNLNGSLVVVVTLLLGSILGLLGALIGGQVKRIF